MTEAETSVIHYVLKHIRSKREAEKTTALKKWLVMKLTVDGFNASICQNSWVTSLGCPAGKSLFFKRNSFFFFQSNSTIYFLTLIKINILSSCVCMFRWFFFPFQ